MLEIDIDIRRLVALSRDESLEQQIHAGGIHLGDAEAIANRGVGGRSPPLAQDADRASESHDVVDGEEVGLVGELLDEGELVLNLLAHLHRHASRPASRHPCIGNSAQMTDRGETGRHDLLGILVAQLIEREPASSRDRECFGQQLVRIHRSESPATAQMPLAAGGQLEAGLGHRTADSNRAQGVGEHPPRTHVHVHVTGCHQRQAGVPGEVDRGLEDAGVVAIAAKRHRQPASPREAFRHPPDRARINEWSMISRR